MNKLTPADLWSLEDYAKRRVQYRQEVMAHKRNRQVALGDHARLLFEDRTTIQYQVQEMLRVERIFEQEGIQDELDAYNPLIPDGSNWKATFLLEYADVDERRQATVDLVGIEDRIWVQVEGCDRVYAIADEDMERDTPEKTSTVHFLRFELDPMMVGRVREGAALAIGSDHSRYAVAVDPVPSEVRQSLAGDLD